MSVQIDGMPMPEKGPRYCTVRRDAAKSETWMGSAERLLLELCGWTVGGTGVCEVRRSKITKDLGMSARKFTRAMNKLLEVGAVERLREGRGRKVARYRVFAAITETAAQRDARRPSGQSDAGRRLRGAAARSAEGVTGRRYKRSTTKQPPTKARGNGAPVGSPAGVAERRKGSAPPAAIAGTCTEDEAPDAGRELRSPDAGDTVRAAVGTVGCTKSP